MIEYYLLLHWINPDFERLSWTKIKELAKWAFYYKDDIMELVNFVQENQAAFGDLKAGTNVFKLILSVLKEYVKWKQS